MSFITGPITNAITNAFSQLYGITFGPLVNTFTSALNTIASIPSAINDALRNIGTIFGSVVQFFLNLPQEITTIGGQLLYAIGMPIVHFANSIYQAIHGFGTFLYSGLERIATGFEKIGADIVGFFDNVKLVLLQVGFELMNTIKTALNNFYTWVQSGFNYIASVISNIFSYFVGTVSQLVSVFSETWNILTWYLGNVVNFGQFFGNVYNTIADLPAIPTNIVKQEVSRIGTALPRVLGYNAAVKTVFSGIEALLRSNTGTLGKMLGILFMPFLAGGIGQLVESVFSSFYPDVKTSSVQKYQIQKTLPSILPSPSPTKTLQVPQQTVPTAGVTLTQHELTQGTAEPYNVHRGTVYPFLIQDVLQVPVLQARVGGFELASQVQALSDTLGININIIQAVVQLQSLSIQDILQPQVQFQSLVTTETPTDAVSASMSAQITYVVLPPAWGICPPPSPYPSYAYPAGTQDLINVAYNVCIPLTSGGFDRIQTGITAQGVPPSTTTDNIQTGITAQGVPPSTTTDNIQTGITAQGSPQPTTSDSINVLLFSQEVAPCTSQELQLTSQETVGSQCQSLNESFTFQVSYA